MHVIKENAWYQVKCQGCIGKGRNDGLYVGEMARPFRERVGKHLTKYGDKDKISACHKHVEEKHGSERQRLELKVVSFCGNDAMLRQVTKLWSLKN